MRLLLLSLSLLPIVRVAEGTLSSGITDFALNLSGDLESASNIASTNFVWSPFSTHAAFSQVLLGARDSTLSELENVLGISKSETSEFGNLQRKVKNGNSTMKIANMVALAKNFKPKTEYTKNLQLRFDSSETFELDFVGNPSGSVRQINDFVTSNTNKKIEKLLNEDQVDPLTKMIIVNAIYFKALWKTEFNPEDTKEEPFESPSGTVNAPFMNGNINTHILETDEVRILELPYQDASKSLLVVLPVDRSETNIIDLLKFVELASIRTAPKKQMIVQMPRFKIKKRTQLKPLMMNAGVRKVFTDSANLRGISDLPLAIDDAVHEAVIEVSEEGTEAAAATAVIVGVRSGVPRNFFSVNRPFAFVLYDFQQDIPIFIGKVNNPVTSESVSQRDFQPQSSSSTAKPEGVCDSQRMNLPNALNNVDLCKQAEEGKMFDWLRSYRTTCEESNKVLNNFKENDCVSEWCEYAKANLQQWTNQQRSCSGRQLDACRTNDNRIKAYERLNCERK